MMMACKPSASDRSGDNEPGSTKGSGPAVTTIVSDFPAFELDELVSEIQQEELAEVATDGESAGWKRTDPGTNPDQLTITNKAASDNSVKFTVYAGTSKAMVAVQQVNAQASTSELWEYTYRPNDEHPEQWNQFLFTDYKVDSFFNEKVQLPEGIRGNRAEPYLDYEFDRKGVTISLSKWRFMRDLESNSLQPEGPLDPAQVKYKYLWNWTGEGFDEEKVNEAGYEDIITFTAQMAGEDENRAHKFDCPHGVKVMASSTLGNHKASNVLDENPATAWSEGAASDGAGEWIEFTINSPNMQIGDRWQISNGFTKTRSLWEENNRVKKFKVLVDDKVFAYVVLANIQAYQSFHIAPPWLKELPSFKKGTRIRFVIEEVYRGSKYNDAVVSYFAPLGNCM